ncbi:hypothetical protein HYX02_00440 [Candidatus Woesearchaeota archaeon]|nr:hypothetical protein [Candidatus Woesearchaeota archaeon]
MLIPFSFGMSQNAMYYNSTIALHWDINVSQENSTLMKTGEPNGDLKVSAEQKKVGAGSAYFDGAGDYLKFPAIDEYKKMQNFSVGCWVNYSNSGSLVVITRQANPDANGDWQLVLVGGTSTVQFYYRGNTGGDAANANYVNAGIFANDATWHLIGFTCNLTSNIMYCYNIFNGTSSQASLSVNSNEPLDNPSAIYVGSNSQNPGTQVYQGGMDECFIINKSLTFGKDSDWEHIYNNGTGRILAQEAGIDTTPPVITGYSNQGSSCTNWNTNPSNPCTTSDTTPTLYFNTSEFAFCAIGISNWNYTQMGSSRNCTVGEGTIEHACELVSQDELVYEDSIVYLSCKDTSGNMNSTSTSGPLSLTVTGLEANGDAAIGAGVQNALLNGYTNYTAQQMHSRNLSNAQARGTFDWMAKKGNKVWAFNYVTKGEQHVNMLNLTPTLYVLEMSNITTANITKAVELMINATK